MNAIKNKFLSVDKLKQLETSMSFLSNYSFKDCLLDDDNPLMNYIKNSDGSVNIESTNLLNQIGIINDLRDNLIKILLTKK